MTPAGPSTVAVIGTGLIGCGWAAVFARAGWRVRLFDPVPGALESAPDRIAEELRLLSRHGLCDDPVGAARLVSVAASLADAVRGAAFVQENGPETEDVKTAVFAELDAVADPDAILASSTSAIVASRFTEMLPGRRRCLVGHPVNPPHLVPLVELCAAPWTDPAVVDRAGAIYSALGQVPVIVRREIDGFVLNRLQGAVLAEAFRLVSEGVISPEDLDRTMKDGLGLRWSFMGPFETIELNARGGLPDYCDRYTGLYKRFAQDPPGPEVFAGPALERVKAAWSAPAEEPRLSDRTAWRNERLAALVRHKRSQKAGPP